MGNSSSFRRLAARFTVVFAACFLFFVFRLIWLGLLDLPPGDRDEIYFDVLAVNLAAGHGFGGALTQEVKEAYASYDPALLQSTDWTAKLGGDDLTTFRPPGYPWLMSLCYRTFGHRLAVVRILNSLLIALGTALLALASLRAGSSGGAVIILLFAIFDPHLFAFSRFGLSEAAAFPLTAGLVAAPLLFENCRRSETLVLGLLLGLSLLTRPVFLFWTPAVCLIAARRAGDGESDLRRLRRVLLVCGLAALIYLPWGFRNSQLLHAIQPFGSQGGIAFGEVYYDRSAVQDWDGNWTAERATKFHNSLPYAAQSIARERQAMMAGNSIMRQWFADYPNELPRLWLSRTKSLWWRDAMPYQRGLIALFVAATMIACIKTRGFWRMSTFAICHTVAICFAYNARGTDELYGRFLCSLYPLFFISVAIALPALLSKTKPVLDSR